MHQKAHVFSCYSLEGQIRSQRTLQDIQDCEDRKETSSLYLDCADTYTRLELWLRDVILADGFFFF